MSVVHPEPRPAIKPVRPCQCVRVFIPDSNALPALDCLRTAWKRLGVQLTVPLLQSPVDLEALIVDTAVGGAADERLFVGAASWLACYHSFVNGQRLSAFVTRMDREATAYIGALLSLAVHAPTGAKQAPEFDTALAQCSVLAEARPLYDVMNTFPVLRARVQAHALPLYTQWGFWHDDATLKPESVRPMTWLLHVPELRARVSLGPSVEKNICLYKVGTVSVSP